MKYLEKKMLQTYKLHHKIQTAVKPLKYQACGKLFAVDSDNKRPLNILFKRSLTFDPFERPILAMSSIDNSKFMLADLIFKKNLKP